MRSSLRSQRRISVIARSHEVTTKQSIQSRPLSHLGLKLEKVEADLIKECTRLKGGKEKIQPGELKAIKDSIKTVSDAYKDAHATKKQREGIQK